MSEVLTGGCQCGAVRFSVSDLGRSAVCHCRMCQKAFGSLFAPLVTVKDGKWTRGAPKWFASSNLARRGFCENCGPPLAYETGYDLEFAVGAFDEPDKVAPKWQVSPRDKVDCYEQLSTLPIKNNSSASWLEFLAAIQSNQHPDHETQSWTPKGKENGQ